jgi:hypothetical protein
LLSKTLKTSKLIKTIHKIKINLSGSFGRPLYLETGGWIPIGANSMPFLLVFVHLDYGPNEQRI